MQAGNKDDLLSLDFGVKEFGVKGAPERLRHYRQYVFQAKREKVPKKIAGLEGVYSLKRLAE